MKIVLYITILSVLLKFNISLAQNRHVDSLINIINVSPDDTHKLSILTVVIEAISDDEVWSKYNDKLGPLSQKLMLSNNPGIKLKAQKHYSDYLNNKGYLFNNLGDINQALDYFIQSLKIQEQIGDKSGQSYSLNNIGFIYNSQKQYLKALEYYVKSYHLQAQLGDKHGQSQSLSNIGNVYDRTGSLKKALYYYFKGLKIRRDINDKQGMGYSMQNIGTVYFNQKNYSSARYYLIKSLELRREIDDAQGISYSLFSLGKIYLEENNIQQAQKYCLEALELAQKMGYPENIGASATLLEEIYLKEEKYNKAHEMLKLAVKMRDSISNTETSKSIVKKQLQYEFEKREVVSKAEQEKRELTYQATSKQQKIIIFASIAGLLLCLFFGIFIYNRFKFSQKQNQIIQEQKKVVEEQKLIVETHQKEVVDSINYAKRIQYALLAHDDLLRKNLRSHFVLFKPKDIVSGDFYWATEHDGDFYLAVCDSTGHGVPGAFMSLLSIGFLSEAIKEKNIKEPNHVFNYVRKRLIESIANEDQKDGFDGILLRIQNSTNTISYAAANNHPIVISNNQILHLPYDKMPVGKGEKTNEFGLYIMDVSKGDTVYLYTDGYADQFGGERGKKFKYKPLNELLNNINTNSLDTQKNILDSTFENWKGDLEQVDDVLVVGVRV